MRLPSPSLTDQIVYPPENLRISIPIDKHPQCCEPSLAELEPVLVGCRFQERGGITAHRRVQTRRVLQGKKQRSEKSNGVGNCDGRDSQRSRDVGDAPREEQDAETRQVDGIGIQRFDQAEWTILSSRKSV